MTEEKKTSNEVIMWKADELPWVELGGVPGGRICRVLNGENSDTIGGGMLNLKNDQMVWTVKYDEVLFVTKGTMSILHEGKRYDGKPGDIIFLRRGTPITYLAEGDAEVAWVLFPVYWKEQMGPQ